jgi:hypothetical protein
MGKKKGTAAAAAASSTPADEPVASAAAAAVRKRLQQATPPNTSHIDHTTGRIKSQADLPEFWKQLQQTQGWLEPESTPAFTDSSAALPDIIRSYTKTFVCNPLVSRRLELAMQV